MDRRRLRHRARKTPGFGVCQLCGPVGAKALAVDEDAVLVDLRPGREIIQNARIDLVSVLVRLVWRLPGAGTIDGEEADPLRDRRRIGLGNGFLATVETGYRQHQRRRARDRKST